MGLSSGAICSFNTAWQMPEQFSRVISWIGRYMSLQWRKNPAIPDGGQDYPDKVLRESKRNIRVLAAGLKPRHAVWSCPTQLWELVCR